MYTVFLVIQILVTLALVALILIQRNDSDGLGSMGGGGGGNAFLTGRGQANLLTRSTAILATLFMLNSLWLSIMASSGNEARSIADELAADEAPVSVPLADDVAPLDEAPVEAAPAAEEPSEIPVEDTAPVEAVEPSREIEQPVIPIP